MQNIKKSEEGLEVTPTDERASGTERVIWNEKETGRAGEVALIKTVHGDAKEARFGTGTATFTCSFLQLVNLSFCSRSS